MLKIGSFVTLTPKAAVPETKMLKLDGILEKRIATLLAEKDSQERKTLIKAHSELKDRQWLGIVKNDVLEEIKRQESIARLKELKKITITNKVTNLNTDLAEKLVTNTLRARFATEIAKLGVAEQHAIELQHAKSSDGIPLFNVRMTSNPNAPVGKILSEGEHRCVALAAFLAELSTLKTSSGIVFDDPVSSLDHIHKDKVAERLAHESQHRQVVVFTHDIAFLVLLEEACQKNVNRPAIPLTYQVISRGSNAAGFCSSEPPNKALPIDKLIPRIRKRLKDVKTFHERGNQDDWGREVDSFSLQLRKAWEKAVEEAVSPVIKRLGKKVHTYNLICLTVLENDDCIKMREAFGRCSNFAHDQPQDINPRLPTPIEIENEIKALEDWMRDIETRQDKVKPDS